MNPEQALQILNNLANLTVTNGGIYQSIDEAAMVKTALQTLTSELQSAASKDAELENLRSSEASSKSQIAQLQSEVAELKATPIV